LKYSFRAYGLGINSSSRIAGLEPSPLQEGEADLWFEDGPEPDWARKLLALPAVVLSHRSEPAGSADPSFILTQHGNEEGFQLSYSDGTRFVMDRASTHIWGTYQAPLTAEDMATYFLGPVLGFVLRRRNFTCLHASGVGIEDRAVCFCGDAGLDLAALKGKRILVRGFIDGRLHPTIAITFPEQIELLARKK